MTLPSLKEVYLKTPLPPKLTAYHVGRELVGGKFSLDYVGSGEGSIRLLGDGVYFATEINIAKLYGKYVEEPFLYTVELDTRKIYNDVQGLPKDIAKQFIERMKSAGGDSLSGSQYKRERDKVTDEFKKSGIITGLWVNLPAGGQEISVFDTNIIKILSKEKLDK